jgi:hypothetical protein
MNCPLGALARVGLARAYAMEGDAAKARAAYQDFLSMWKGANPDIPILKEIKTVRKVAIVAWQTSNHA